MANKAYKYRIYPDEQQANMIARCAGCARFIYNQYVAWWNDNNKKDENGNWIKTPNLPCVTHFSRNAEYFFLKEVDSLALANALLNFRTALKNFFDSRTGKRKDKKKKGSKNREKARVKLAKEHEKIANRRREHCIQTALYFVRNYDVVVIESLDMRAMSKSLNLGKSVHDLAWGQFVQWLELEASRHFCTIVKADKWYASSKLCNHCGAKNKDLKLSDREWVCPECGAVIDRDYNAACSLRDYYIKGLNTVATTGIKGCGDIDRYDDGKTVTASRAVEAASPLL